MSKLIMSNITLSNLHACVLMSKMSSALNICFCKPEANRPIVCYHFSYVHVIFHSLEERYPALHR